jgi:hypothetical protein
MGPGERGVEDMDTVTVSSQCAKVVVAKRIRRERSAIVFDA